MKNIQRQERNHTSGNHMHLVNPITTPLVLLRAFTSDYFFPGALANESFCSKYCYK
jgi:hypothetical protein